MSALSKFGSICCVYYQGSSMSCSFGKAVRCPLLRTHSSCCYCRASSSCHIGFGTCCTSCLNNVVHQRLKKIISFDCHEALVYSALFKLICKFECICLLQPAHGKNQNGLWLPEFKCPTHLPCTIIN